MLQPENPDSKKSSGLNSLAPLHILPAASTNIDELNQMQPLPPPMSLPTGNSETSSFGHSAVQNLSPQNSSAHQRQYSDSEVTTNTVSLQFRVPHDGVPHQRLHSSPSLDTRSLSSKSHRFIVNIPSFDPITPTPRGHKEGAIKKEPLPYDQSEGTPAADKEPGTYGYDLRRPTPTIDIHSPGKDEITEELLTPLNSISSPLAVIRESSEKLEVDEIKPIKKIPFATDKNEEKLTLALRNKQAIRYRLNKDMDKLYRASTKNNILDWRLLSDNLEQYLIRKNLAQADSQQSLSQYILSCLKEAGQFFERLMIRDHKLTLGRVALIIAALVYAFGMAVSTVSPDDFAKQNDSDRFGSLIKMFAAFTVNFMMTMFYSGSAFHSASKALRKEGQRLSTLLLLSIAGYAATGSSEITADGVRFSNDKNSFAYQFPHWGVYGLSFITILVTRYDGLVNMSHALAIYLAREIKKIFQIQNNVFTRWATRPSMTRDINRENLEYFFRVKAPWNMNEYDTKMFMLVYHKYRGKITADNAAAIVKDWLTYYRKRLQNINTHGSFNNEFNHLAPWYAAGSKLRRFILPAFTVLPSIAVLPTFAIKAGNGLSELCNLLKISHHEWGEDSKGGTGIIPGITSAIFYQRSGLRLGGAIENALYELLALNKTFFNKGLRHWVPRVLGVATLCTILGLSGLTMLSASLSALTITIWYKWLETFPGKLTFAILNDIGAIIANAVGLLRLIFDFNPQRREYDLSVFNIGRLIEYFKLLEVPDAQNIIRHNSVTPIEYSTSTNTSLLAENQLDSNNTANPAAIRKTLIKTEINEIARDILQLLTDLEAQPSHLRADTFRHTSHRYQEAELMPSRSSSPQVSTNRSTSNFSSSEHVGHANKSIFTLFGKTNRQDYTPIPENTTAIANQEQPKNICHIM